MRKINYDEKNDILFVHEGFKSDEQFKGNIDAGDVVLDISTQKRVRGIEIMNATRFFKDMFSGLDAETVLKNIIDAKLNTSIKPNGITIGLLIKSKASEKELPAKLIVSLERPLYA